MKWKNQIWIFDDIIPVEQQEKIKSTLLGEKYPWRYVDDITGGGSQDKRPAYSHTFVREGVIYSHDNYIRMLEPMWSSCFEKLYEKTRTKGDYSVLASRAFLQRPLGQVRGREYDAHHIDRIEDHLAFLYYVCDADGDTVIFENMYSRNNPRPPEPYELKEKVRVTPKQGRVVIFDGYYWHTATQPSENVRCVVNTDILQHA